MTILEYIRSKVRVSLTEDNVRALLVDRDLLSDETSDATSLDAQTRELLYADALMLIATSPNGTASVSIEHGGFAQRTGSERNERQDMFIQMAMDIYKKWNDERYVEDNRLSWLDNDD